MHGILTESLTEDSLRTHVPTHDRRGREGKGGEGKGVDLLCRGHQKRALASEDPYPTPCTPRQTQARNVTTDRAQARRADGGTR
jgi:hypothetical protein